MSTGNADLVRGGFEAFLDGDFDALRKLMDPEAQWLWYQCLGFQVTATHPEGSPPRVLADGVRDGRDEASPAGRVRAHP